jgi:hypothetical protein
MNAKLVLAFMTGAVIASGIVYVAVRPEQPKVVRAAAAATAPQQPVPQVLPPPPPPPEPVAAAPPPVERVREKPSPMPAAVRRERPAVVARVEVPQRPAPQPQPVPSRPYVEARLPEPAPVAAPPEPPPPLAPTPQPAVQVQEAPGLPPAPESDVRTPHSVTLAAGTNLSVRIGETITSRSHYPGDTFLATLDRPLVIDGFIIAERGARVEGRVIDARQSGQGNNNVGPRFEIELVKLATADGQYIPIHTLPFQRAVKRTSGADAATVIGAGAAIGAAIGGASSGGKGAAVGAGIGGAAGAAGVLLTRDRAVEIPVETRLSFSVRDPVVITEKVN